MSKISVTTRIDESLNEALEEIARFDGSSSSELAGQAIRNLVEERQATRDLVRLGLAMVESGERGVSGEAVRDWLEADDDEPFPVKG